CSNHRRDGMTIRRRQVVLLALAKDDHECDRPEIWEMDVAYTVGPAPASSRLPPSESEFPQPASPLNDRGFHWVVEDLEFEALEVVTIEAKAIPVTEERREPDESRPLSGLEWVHPLLRPTSQRSLDHKTFFYH